MSFNLSENTIGLWFVAMSGQDWMAHIEERKDSYHLEYRHRYYRDDKNFDSDDEKNWYAADMPKEEITKKQAIELIDSCAKGAEELFGGKLTKIMKCADESLQQFLDRFQKLPFVHVQKVSKEEAEERGYCTQD